MFTLYQVECMTPNHFYIGISTDINRRIIEHQNGRGARFTRKHGVRTITLLQTFPSATAAKKAERETVIALQNHGLIAAGAAWCQSRRGE